MREQYVNKIFGNLKCIGETGTLKRGSRVFLFRNIVTGKTETHTIYNVKNGLALGKNETGFNGKGYKFDKRTNSWRIELYNNGKRYNEGPFKDEDSAKNREKVVIEYLYKNKEFPKKEEFLRSNNSSGYTGVQWDKNKLAWISSIGINGKNYYLGTSKNSIEGYKKYKAAKYNWEEFKQLPKKLRTNSSGEKYVSYDSKTQRWAFAKVKNGTRIKKTFTTLSDAIAYKHEFLKEHGLTE